jgi:hypothetical protein
LDFARLERSLLTASAVLALQSGAAGQVVPEAADANALPAYRAPASCPDAASWVGEVLARSRALDELRLVDSAREALQSGDATRALDLLQHYEARIKEPQFELEVAVLRMNALDRLGRTDAARRQARQLLTRPLPEKQAARARAILDGRTSFE